MNGEDKSASGDAERPVEPSEPVEDLVRRVVSSSTFEKSPKLRAFLHYVCRCAIDGDPAAATEQQIGIHVFGRQPGYNPNEDNIVRSQARLLRLKLEHHFAHEGKDEPVVITIPKGRYLPAFERRPDESTGQLPEPAGQPQIESRGSRTLLLFIGLTVVFALAIVWLGSTLLRSKGTSSISPPSALSPRDRAETGTSAPASQIAMPPVGSEVRITAGNMGGPYVDVWGHRWGGDQFYEGGVSRPGPQDLFPPVPDANLFKTIREGTSAESMGSEGQSEFRYDIPVPPGVYELRLYFADPVRRTALETLQDAQNVRHFQVNVNGHAVLSGFDAVADAGSAPVDVRAFKDISPTPDGKVHLEFIPAPERPFVNALELTPGIPGKLKPIRLSAHRSDLVDSDGTRWAGDNYFIGGRITVYTNPKEGPKVPELYTVERFGNFSYAIPVPPGSYTVKLHFLESFFNPLNPATVLCRGGGCRVFDVTCNGVALLENFDVFQAAGGAFRPVVRAFHNLHPDGQGKLLLSFSPKVNYAEVRAIEVINEGQ